MRVVVIGSEGFIGQALVARLLRAVVKRLDFVERAQVRARSNGRVRF